jgi:hypothetical protein
MTIGQGCVVAAPEGGEFTGFAYPGSLVVLPDNGLLATFTGHRDRQPCCAVGAYSEDGGRTWGAPVVLFGGDHLGSTTVDLGEGYADPNLVVADQRAVQVLCVSLRHDNEVLDLSRTRFWRRRSVDGGRTFGPVEELPRHRKYYVGMVSPGLRLTDGSLVMGYSWDKPAEVGRPADGEGTMDLVSGVLISRDEGVTWTPGGDCYVDTVRSGDALPHATNGLDEPAVVELPDGELFLLGRTGTHRLWQSRSRDRGLSWDLPEPSLLISHNCPAALLRLADGVSVAVVYNDHPQQRLNLVLRISRDGCRTWSPAIPLGPLGQVSEQAQAAYPNLCQLSDGTVVVVFYQVDRGPHPTPFTIRAVRLAPSELPLPAAPA